MNERELELVVTREEGEIKKVRIRKGSEYIYEILPYLNKFGYIEFKDIIHNVVRETGFEFKHPVLYSLVQPTEQLLTDIRTNFLKMKAMSGNYYLRVHDEELILNNSSDDDCVVGTIKFFDKNIEHTAQEYFNNITNELRNKDDLILSLSRGEDDDLLYLYKSDHYTLLDVCGINETEIKAMLSDEHGGCITSNELIKKLIYLIYRKRRSSLLYDESCTLGTYISNLKNKEKNNEVK